MMETAGKVELTRRQQTAKNPPTIYKVREDFIMETKYVDFYHKIEKAMQNPHKPAFVSHKIYPTDQTRAAQYNADTKHNKKMFEMITKGMCDGSRRVCEEENAGGCSVFSEVLSCEVVTRLFNAQLMKTEMEIAYVHDGSKKTDFLVNINGKNIGVSVTRAFKYKRPTAQDKEMFAEFTLEDAQNLLRKKLMGVVSANECVVGPDVWEKQILHIFVPNKEVTKTLKHAYKNMKHGYRKNTMVIVTETSNMDCIYSEKLNDHI